MSNVDVFARAGGPGRGIIRSTVPSGEEVDVVAALERDLRAEKKDQKESEQSQQLGASGANLPDIFNGKNVPLLQKAKRYAPGDPVTGTNSVLGDFSRLLDQEQDRPTSASGQARNQLLAMSYSTLENRATEPQRIIESQLPYQLAASSYGLGSMEERGYRKARNKNKFADNGIFY